MTATHPSRPIGFIDHARVCSLHAVQASRQTQLSPGAADAILRFDGGETVGLADLLHIALVLGTTGSGKTTSVLLPALDALIGRGFGGLVVDVKGSMCPAVRAIAARYGRGADVLEIGPHETAAPIDLLAGATVHGASELFRALFMAHAAGDERNQSFHTAGLAQAVDAWQILSRRCRDTGEPFSLTAFDRLLNEPEFATGVFNAFQASLNLSPTEQALARRIEGASAHVIPADAKTATQRVWHEQVTYDMSALRTGLRLFRASPGLEQRFFAPGGASLDMERWIYDDHRIVVLRLSPATGEAGAGISRHLLHGFYQAVYDRGLSLPDGQATFLMADEFQDFISTDPVDPLNDAAFLAKVREFRCAVLLGTQSAIALAQRARHGMSDVRTILGNCNVRVFLYGDEPETVSLAPASETPLDELGPGQAVLVHYDAVSRIHRHSTTGVNDMHARLTPVLAGAVREPGQLATPGPDETEQERKRQALLVAAPIQSTAPAQAASATDEIVEESPAEAALAIVQKSRGADLAHVPAAHRTLAVCLAAVQNDGRTLQFVPENLKDAELCLEAVRQNGWALEFVPAALKTVDLCLEAVAQDGLALQYVPEALKTPEICLEAVAQDGMALADIPARHRTPDLCLAAVQNTGAALEYVPARLRTKALCLAAVRSTGWALKFVPEALKTAQLCLAAVRR
nr:DUF4116 domain-containing protein [Desulfovibrio sp.]